MFALDQKILPFDLACKVDRYAFEYSAKKLHSLLRRRNMDRKTQKMLFKNINYVPDLMVQCRTKFGYTGLYYHVKIYDGGFYVLDFVKSLNSDIIPRHATCLKHLYNYDWDWISNGMNILFEDNCRHNVATYLRSDNIALDRNSVKNMMMLLDICSSIF